MSYGTRQPVATIARRALRDVRMHYSVNGGRTRSVRVREWQGGERYGNTHDDYYAELRGTVTGTEAGDEVEVWFSGRKRGDRTGDQRALHLQGARRHRRRRADPRRRGRDRPQPRAGRGTGAKYADEMAAALTAAGRTSDVYDFDTQGREAPHHLGVLSHYDAVLWETGDDIILRAPGQVPGTTMKAALDTELSVRDYLNEGGKALVSGKYALYAQAANGAYFYNPNAPAEPECTDPDDPVCLPVFNDFLQYWLGAYTYIDGGGTAADGTAYPLSGIADPYTGWDATLDDSQDHTASFLPTSSFLPPSEFPWFGPSSAPVDWARPGAAPFEPHTGDWHLFSGQADVSYKRLTRTVDLTGATTGQLRFFTSYETESDWDYLFVEAHEVGTDDVDHAAGRQRSHRHRHRPQLPGGLDPEAAPVPGPLPDLRCRRSCTSTGTTGSWNAATGASAGSEEWAVDLSAYAGKQVELSISYVSDWGTQGLGVFLDDVSVTVGGPRSLRPRSRPDLGGWTVAGPPEGSAPNPNDWARSQLAYEEGAVTATTDTIYTGFGLEGLSAEERAEFVTRSMQHLLGGAPAVNPAAVPANRR